MRTSSSAAGVPRWLAFDRRDIGLAFTLSVLAIFINTSAAFGLLRKLSLLQWVEWFVHGLVVGMAMSCVSVAALHASERLSIQGWHRHAATILIGMTVAFVITVPDVLFAWPRTPSVLRYGITSSLPAFLLYAMWLNAALALVARAWLVESREATQASRLLTRMRSEQMAIRRRLVEGRLKAIQARVDPLFFFAMLEVVQKTYAVNVDRAEQLLDELTAFLRAALPRLRTASSTVEQECELACAFARVRELAGLGASRLEVDIAPAVGAASFPPGVLLPLVDELLRATRDPACTNISFSIDAAAPADSARSAVVAQLTAQADPSSEVLSKTRATLLDLFGATAELTTSAVDGGVRTTVRVPYESAGAIGDAAPTSVAGTGRAEHA